MGSYAPEHGRVAIVTGSTSGIGLDVTNLLLGKGYSVAISGRRADHGEAVAKELNKEGGERVIFVQCDVSSYSSQVNLFQQTWNKWGRIDVVVANAGFPDQWSAYNLSRKSAAVTDVPPEPDLGCTDTNLKGVIYSTTISTHFMRHNPTPGGKIIITGSILGIIPSALIPEYCASKAGVTHWCRSMAPVLLSKENIAMNCVLPGPYQTPATPDLSPAYKPEHLTLKSCILEAYNVFIEDDTRSRIGQTVETGHDKLFYYESPASLSGGVAKRAAAVYEPYFQAFHGENSGVEGTLTGHQPDAPE